MYTCLYSLGMKGCDMHVVICMFVKHDGSKTEIWWTWMFVFFSQAGSYTLPFLIIIQAMGTNAGQISLPTEMEILERVESQRFVDRSHPADSFIYCSTPQCQCWVWTYRLSRTCQTCLGCGGTWQVSYLHNGYSFWPFVGQWLHWLKNVMEKKHFAALHLGLYMLTSSQFLAGNIFPKHWVYHVVHVMWCHVMTCAASCNIGCMFW